MVSSPKVIDLYSGVGGLSLGAVKAGFSLAGAVEKEKRIIDSHALNFPNSNHICEDVSLLKAKKLRADIKIGSQEIAGLIGGPPCQGFSSIGKRNIKDDRNQLFTSFFTLANELQPAFFLAENVPGILNAQYDKIRRKAFSIVENDYQILDPIKISANDFGAATTRTRIFFIGVRNDIKGGDMILQSINALKSKSPIYVHHALKGLPSKINENWIEYKDSWRKVNNSSANHYSEILNAVIDGVGDEVSIKRLIEKSEVSGCFGTRHSVDVAERYAALAPGEQDKISRSHKLDSNGFCPTLRAGTDNTKGSFQAVRPIHPTQARVITPREAARLQGFPDWFQFHETKWHSFRQIGNSVCPIAATKVLQAVKTSLSM